MAVEEVTVTASAVLRRLRALGEDVPGPDDAWQIVRTYAGRHQRSAGALSWTLELKNYHSATTEQRRYHNVIGGYWPARMCAKVGATLENGSFYTILKPPKNKK